MVKMPYWPAPIGRSDIFLSLERMTAILSTIGRPELNLPPVIHVAGTNGKGSTIAYLRGILECSGYSVHRYISPHLINFNERIMLCGQEISDTKLFQFIEICRLALESHSDLRYSFFEATTAIAFLAFSSIPADALLLEVGMGGRLDPTNVITNPELSIITPISLDHTEFLGESINLIAKQKAGIIKPKCPCLIGWQYKEAMDVLKNYCIEVDAQYFAYNEHWNFTVEGDKFYVHIINNDINPVTTTFGPYKQSLEGIHQITNAATAVVAAYILEHSRYPKINSKFIEKGIATAVWPARMERIVSGKLFNLLPQNCEVWLDGAHNPNGAEMLSASIKKMPNKMPLYIIHGRSARHNIQIFLEHFMDLNPELICCLKVQSELKGEAAEIIEEEAKKMGFRAISCTSVIDAVETCINHMRQQHNALGRIIICGSLYLAGDVLAANKEL